jgi:endonuclease-3
MVATQTDLGFPYPQAVSRIGAKTQARAAAIEARFDEQYPGAPVPSLNFADPYQCVVAVSLSAQTTDDNVNKVLPRLFARFPDVTALASADVLELETIIHSLGFFHNKAKNLLGLARTVVAEYDGQIPRTMDALTSLPGVARKTANIVLAESFGVVQGIAVDTHVFRLAHRLGLSRAKTPAATEGDLCKAFAYDRWYRVNFEMITHGRRVCTAQRPRCEECFLADLCPSAGKV